MKERFNILVVDDSPSVRLAVKDLLLRDPDIANVTTATNGRFALSKLRFFQPDAIILDLEMPEMDGLSFLRAYKKPDTPPVILFSVHTYRGGKLTVQGLAEGAFDFVTKPDQLLRGDFAETGRELLTKVKVAARKYRRRHRRSQPPPPAAPEHLSLPESKSLLRPEVIVMGASTGGTRAIETILSRLQPPLPPVVVAIHMPANFTGPFAERLHQITALSVAEGENGQTLLENHVYVAPGGKQTRVKRLLQRGLFLSVTEEKEFLYSPSVDVLFHSAAEAARKNVLAVLLTGMGSDGAAAMKTLHDLGAATVAQDETTSAVFGMPRAAIELGAADWILPVQNIAAVVQHVAAAGPMYSAVR